MEQNINKIAVICRSCMQRYECLTESFLLKDSEQTYCYRNFLFSLLDEKKREMMHERAETMSNLHKQI